MTLACLLYDPRMSAIRQRFSPEIGASLVGPEPELFFSPEAFDDLEEVLSEVLVV